MTHHGGQGQWRIIESSSLSKGNLNEGLELKSTCFLLLRGFLRLKTPQVVNLFLETRFVLAVGGDSEEGGLYLPDVMSEQAAILLDLSTS